MLKSTYGSYIQSLIYKNDNERLKCFYNLYYFSRPLSPEAIAYARSDTHYLLYVYDMIKKDLMAMSTNQSDYIKLVFERSTNLCKMVNTYKLVF